MTDDPDPSGGASTEVRMPTTQTVIAVSLESSSWRLLDLDIESLCRQAVGGVLGVVAPGSRGLEISIVLGDDNLVRRLNREARGFDRSTNVLAFPCDPPTGKLPQDAPRLLGDVVLAHETIAREARRQGKLFANHLRHLVVHGALHLLGYDHENEVKAQAMEALETAILADMGVPDPYAIDSAQVGEPA